MITDDNVEPSIAFLWRILPCLIKECMLENREREREREMDWSCYIWGDSDTPPLSSSWLLVYISMLIFYTWQYFNLGSCKFYEVVENFLLRYFFITYCDWDNVLGC